MADHPNNLTTLLILKRHLSDLAFGGDATAACHKIDRYRRNVCSASVSDAGLRLEQLRAGLAWVFTQYAHELAAQRRAECTEAERDACDGQLGLWRDDFAAAQALRAAAQRAVALRI